MNGASSAGYQRTNPFRLGYFGNALQSTFTNTFSSFAGAAVAIMRLPTTVRTTWSGQADAVTLPFGQQSVHRSTEHDGRHFITTIYDTLTMNRGNHTLTVGSAIAGLEDIGRFSGCPYALGTPSGVRCNITANFPASQHCCPVILPSITL